MRSNADDSDAEQYFGLNSLTSGIAIFTPGLVGLHRDAF